MFDIVALFSESGLSFWEKVAAWYETSLLNELLTYFEERYFTVKFGVYENFSINAGTGTTVRNVIVAVAVGLIVAFLMTAYFRMGLGNFVRKLLREKCFAPESAKTLMELGYFQSTVIRRELTRGASLRMVVRQCDGEVPPVEEAPPSGDADKSTDAETADEKKTDGDASKNDAKPDDGAANSAESTEKKGTSGAKGAKGIDFLTARFYIPEDLRARAEIRFEKKGSGWGAVIIGIVATVVATGLLCWLLPDVVALADNLITVFSP